MQNGSKWHVPWMRLFCHCFPFIVFTVPKDRGEVGTSFLRIPRHPRSCAAAKRTLKNGWGTPVFWFPTPSHSPHDLWSCAQNWEKLVVILTTNSKTSQVIYMFSSSSGGAAPFSSVTTEKSPYDVSSGYTCSS